MIGSPEINKVIRKSLSPILKENGFNKVNTRNNWRWIDQCIWVLKIGAVGNYFSEVTGWSPMSIHVELGIYYVFIPSIEEIKKGTNGELLPKEYQCHLREELNCNLNQSNYTRHLDNPADRTRTDIWWVEPDGSNVNEVIEDIGKSFVEKGLNWYINNTDLETAFNTIENQHNDGYDKYYKAKYFAELLKQEEKFDMYNYLFEQEKKRIDS